MKKMIYYSWLFYTDRLADIQYTLDSPLQRYLDFINEMSDYVLFNTIIWSLRYSIPIWI